MPEQVAIDTTVLVGANITQTPEPAESALQAARLALIQRIQGHQAAVLISAKLVAEYRKQITTYRNDSVRLFFELLTKPDGSHVILNWRTPWGHAELARARACRFPKEDLHVLRTAVRDDRTTLYSEEGRVLAAHPCIRKKFDVVISTP
jgi:hypothetical protein